jgi:hypothetical protein
MPAVTSGLIVEKKEKNEERKNLAVSHHMDIIGIMAFLEKREPMGRRSKMGCSTLSTIAA